jgi:inorganic triphosphatase YgiF
MADLVGGARRPPRRQVDPKSDDMNNRNQDPAGGAIAAPAGGEVELKLRGEPEALKAVFAGPAISARATGRGTSRRLENVYYDTADQRLRARGLAFRVRRDGRRYLQTLKSNDAAGLVAWRGEWQSPLGSADPDLDLLPPEAGEVLEGLVAPGELRSLFTTRVRRQTRRLAAGLNGGPPTLIEAALDLGAIEADGRSQPIAEIELELIDGPARALYDLALELDALTPLQLETRSKSVRGYTLARGEPPAWQKAEAVALKPRSTVDAALGKILRACVRHWCANEAAALDGGDPEGVHQMRVALRRLRSALSAFGRLIQPERRAWLSGEAKRVLGSLEPARDWDVFLTESLAPVLAARPEDRSLLALQGAAQAARAEGYAAVRAAIADPAYTRFLLQLGSWIEAGGWREDATPKGAAWLDRPAKGFADRLLAKRHRTALKRGRDFSSLAPAERHRLRIALKKLRYATEFFHSLYPKKSAQSYLAALKALQDTLGHLNDVAVAERLASELEGRAAEDRSALARGSGLVLGWLARGSAEAEPEVAKAWQAFADRKPFWS